MKVFEVHVTQPYTAVQRYTANTCHFHGTYAYDVYFLSCAMFIGEIKETKLITLELTILVNKSFGILSMKCNDIICRIELNNRNIR